MPEVLPPKLAGLLTIPESGPAPEQRVKTVSDARKLSDTLKREDLPYAYTRRLVNAQIGGAPPFANVPIDLQWVPNVNLLDGAAEIERARIPYYQLLNVDAYATISSPFAQGDPNHDKWEALGAKFFHETINRWEDWYWEYQGKDYEMLKHGIGPIMFEDYPNWRFRALDSGAMKVPKDTRSGVSARMPYCTIHTSERIHTLWGHIRDEAAATKAGWNVPAVRKVIMHGMKGHDSNSWDYYERILLTQDLTASYSDGDVVECVTLLNQEFNGKVSRLMYPQNGFSTPAGKPDNAEEFMFSDVGKYDNYSQCVVAFFHELGDYRTWHSVKGLGQKGYRYHAIINQMNCRMLAGAEMATGITLQLGDTKSKDAANIVQRGLVTYIPPTAKLLPQPQPGGFLDGPITVVRIMDNRHAANQGQSGTRALSRDDGKGEMPTATQVDAQVTESASLNQGQISLHFLSKDAMFSEMFRRMSMKGTTDKESQRFQQMCSDAGIPPEFFKDCTVKANRLSGYGSANLRHLSDEQMLQSGAVAAMRPENQIKFWRFYTGGVKGADKIDEFFPFDDPVNRDQIDAEFENSLFATATEPLLLYGDDTIHLQSHIPYLQKKFAPVEQAINQGVNDPQQVQAAYQELQIAGPHIEEHVSSMQKNKYRAKEAKLFQDQLTQLVQFNSKLRGALRDIQRQQTINAEQTKAATTLGVLDQAKLQSMQVENTIKTTKAQADITRKDALAVNNARLKTITTLHSLHQTAVKGAVDNAVALKATKTNSLAPSGATK